MASTIITRDLTTMTDAAGQQTRSGTNTGGGSESGTSSTNTVVKNTDGSETDVSFRDDFNYQGNWAEGYGDGAASASAINDQTGYWQLLDKSNGVLTDEQHFGYEAPSTSPGFDPYHSNSGNGVLSNTFLIGGDPSFGRTIPSATSQAPSNIAVPHGAYDPGPVTTPNWVNGTAFALNIVGVLLTAGGGAEADAALEGTEEVASGATAASAAEPTTMVFKMTVTIGEDGTVEAGPFINPEDPGFGRGIGPWEPPLMLLLGGGRIGEKISAYNAKLVVNYCPPCIDDL